MDTDIPEGKRAKYRITPMDVSGNPAVIDGNVTYSSADDTLLQVVADTASPNSTEFWVQNAVGGSLGPCAISARVDADQGSGVTPVTASYSWNAVAGQAATIGVEQMGALEDIPAAPPGP